MIKLLKNLKGRDWILLLIAVVFIYGSVWLDLRIPDYMSKITSLIQTPGSHIKDILINGGYMLLCALVCLIFAVIVGLIIAKVSAGFSMNLREKLFVKVCNLSSSEINKYSTGSLITRTTNDIGQVEMVIGMGLQLLIRAPFTAITAVIKILNRSMVWSMYTAVGVIILLSIVITLMIIVVPKFKLVQKMLDQINGVTRENLNGIRVVRAFNAEKYQENKFESINNRLTKQQIFNQKAFAIMSPMMYLVMHFLTLAIAISASFIISGAGLYDKIETFGNMVVFTSYSSMVIMSFLMLAVVFMVIPRAMISAGRINEVLDCKISIKEGKSKEVPPERGTVEFKNVSFKYPDAENDVISNISFKAEKGQTIAFIGSTGSGKSSLINLIARFYDATSGEVLVDGVNVKDYKFEDLYNKISYISQKAVIFSGTINSNVAFGKGNEIINEQKVKEVIEIAQAKDFVEKMDKGYDSHVAQAGSNLSGGQKQRLSIARAIARDPEIYIFDDAFSALDYKTDATLRKCLKDYTKNATCLIVAQRIGTIMNADEIIVLDQGRCVGRGTHEELLKKCEIYKQIALSQISEEELHNGRTK